MQDDLKFASEAITQIAMQAMKSIENLYANRNFDNSDNSDPPSRNSNLSPKVNISNSSNDLNIQNDDYFDDPRFSIIEEQPKAQKPEVQEPKISKSKIDRPPKYDSDLENLLL